MTRRKPGARMEWRGLKHLQGRRATADGGECTRCPHPILKEQRIVMDAGHWIHADCWARDHE